MLLATPFNRCDWMFYMLIYSKCKGKVRSLINQEKALLSLPQSLLKGITLKASSYNLRLTQNFYVFGGKT